MRIPNLPERGKRKNSLHNSTQEDRINPFPNIPKPENWGMHPTFQGQDFQHSSWRLPGSKGVTSDQGISHINVAPIISEIINWPENEPIPLGDEYKMTDEQIEDAIAEMARVGLHEGTHMALNTIFPYEGWDSHNIGHDKWMKAHEIGAAHGENYNRLDALRAMATHPMLSDIDWQDENAMSSNPYMQRLTELFMGADDSSDEEYMEELLAEYAGLLARENAAARGGSK